MRLCIVPSVVLSNKSKENAACQSPNNHIVFTIYHELLLLLILTLVAKSFSSSYKELSSAQATTVEDSMKGGNNRNPLATLLSLFQPVCVYQTTTTKTISD